MSFFSFLPNVMFHSSKRFNIYLLFYTLLNILQAKYTDLISDEVYYWEYSKYLDWGYMDHPPAIALLIRLGWTIFKSELGVRLLTALTSSATALIIWHMIPRSLKNHKHAENLFFLILLSIPGFTIYSFISTPDVPLIFFFSLYLLIFKKFNENPTTLNTVLLGFCAAALIYSKYHGGLFILLSIICQPSLLKNRNLYLSGLIALILIIPHLYWQYSHDFVSFRYHLIDRVDSKLELNDILMGSLAGALGILNPGFLILSIVLIAKNIRKIPEQQIFMTRMFGAVVLFFTIYAFRSYVEAHWFVAAFIPMTIFLYDWSIKSDKRIRIIKYISFPIISILLIIRILIALPVETYNRINKNILPHLTFTDFNKKPNPNYIKLLKLASEKNLNVVFAGSHTKTSNYMFYTGAQSISWGSAARRINQFDVGNYETLFNNRRTLIVYGIDFEKENPIETLSSRVVDHFLMLPKLKAKIIDPIDSTKQNTDVLVKIDIYNPYNYDISFDGDPTLKLGLFFINAKNNKKEYYVSAVHKNKLSILKSRGNISAKIQARINLPKGQYKMKLTIQQGALEPQRLGNKVYDIEIL